MKDKRTSYKKINVVKSAIFMVLAAIILFVFIYGTHVRKTVSKWDGVIYPGICVENIDLGGMTREEAVETLNTEYRDKILLKNIEVNVGENSYSLSYDKLNAKYNIEEAAENAYNMYRNDGMLKKYRIIEKGAQEDLKLDFEADTGVIDEFVDKISEENSIEPTNASISINNGNISITPSATGNEVDKDELKEKIIGSINGNLDSIEPIEAELHEADPKIKEEDLKRINGKMSTYSTNFASSSSGRASNVELSTSSVNGTILMPGDTFSYNDVVGERTAERGYKEAGVIIGNKVDTGLGGGICQTSSTLYQAVIRAGIKSVERHNHSLVVGYMPKGYDATVSWGGPDYKFTNTYDFPIYIEGYCENRNIVFNIYGDITASDKTYDISNDVYETLTPETKTVEDSSLSEGQQVSDVSPVTGYRVKTYLNTYEGGTLVSSELISNDTYNKVDGVVKVGTKKAEPAPNPETQVKPAENTPPETQAGNSENSENTSSENQNDKKPETKPGTNGSSENSSAQP